MSVEYRLRFDTIDMTQAAEMEARCGRGVWLALNDKEWDGLRWHTVEKVTTDPWDQYNRLCQWAESHEQPIRDVTLHRRVIPDPDTGWEAVKR